MLQVRDPVVGELRYQPASLHLWYPEGHRQRPAVWEAAMIHYTDKAGHATVASQKVWLFVASQPPPSEHPFGTYFTTLPPSTPKLASRLRIPKAKITYFFEFKDDGSLRPLPGGRGAYVFYSPTDYSVALDRQLDHGLSSTRGGVTE